MAPPARADRLDDDLNTLWEATWDERGTPTPLVRWNQPIRYQFTDERELHQRPTVVAALEAVAKAAGVSIASADATTPPDTVNLKIEFVSEQALGNSVGCLVNHRSRAFVLTEVRLKLLPSEAWSCAHHEAMHVMGIRGHPTGRTVLSYFPWRRDALMPMDRLMLTTWYDPALQPGATPFELLWKGSLHVAQQPDLGIDLMQAQERRQRHYRQRIDEMEAFAQGQGDAPLVIKRSGHASPGHIQEARVSIAYYLGLAYLRSVGVAKDETRAAQWFSHAAERAHHPSMVLLARALASGRGLDQDRIEAHRWLASAVRAGNTVAPNELQALETRMNAIELDKARALGPRLAGS
jgi:hypothetical protein